MTHAILAWLILNQIALLIFMQKASQPDYSRVKQNEERDHGERDQRNHIANHGGLS